MDKVSDTFKFSNGREVPCIGFGTWDLADGEEAASAIKNALEAGYRHIDTAALYKNEKSVGKAVRESGIKRSEVFVTSKAWTNARGYERAKQAFAKSLADLGLDYLDLYLIHWPASASRYPDWEKINLDTWGALTDLYKQGLIKAIGVSNFLAHHLEALMKTEVPPMANQIEFHPGQMQRGTLDYCKKNGILVEAWGPLGQGKMLSNPGLKSIAAKYQKSAAQLCIKWCLQNDVVPLPKSANRARMEENSKVFDFSISSDDMEAINAMPYFGGSGQHPDKVAF
jgi:diketogulonate reductase-like aldo/keto reductase